MRAAAVSGGPNRLVARGLRAQNEPHAQERARDLPPLFSPSSARVSLQTSTELLLIDLQSSEVLYRGTLSSPSRHTSGWVDEDHFLYDDASTIYIVQL